MGGEANGNSGKRRDGKGFWENCGKGWMLSFEGRCKDTHGVVVDLRGKGEAIACDNSQLSLS